MARQVSTWSQLVAALSTSPGNDSDIEITADIDCNDEIPMGVSSTIKIKYQTSYGITIDGKGHQIRNLRTHVTSPVPIFKNEENLQSGKLICFKNIKFLNLMGSTNIFWSSTENNNYPGVFKFQNCDFVGKRDNGYLALINATHSYQLQGAQIIFESCFINYPMTSTNTNRYDQIPLTHIGNGNSNSYAIANFCRIRESVTPLPDAGGGTYSPTSCCHNMRLNGSRVEGSLRAMTYDTMPYLNINGGAINENVSEYGYQYSSPVQNVIDVDWVCANNQSLYSTGRIVAPSGVIKKSLKRESGAAVSISSWDNNGNSGTIPVTPEEMTQPSVLASKGFDIAT